MTERLAGHFDPDRLAIRCLQEAMATALPSWWRKRSAQFDAIHPEIQPLPLTASPQWVARVPEAVRIALACRRHAWLLEQGLPSYIEDEIAALDEALT